MAERERKRYAEDSWGWGGRTKEYQLKEVSCGWQSRAAKKQVEENMQIARFRTPFGDLPIPLGMETCEKYAHRSGGKQTEYSRLYLVITPLKYWCGSEFMEVQFEQKGKYHDGAARE